MDFLWFSWGKNTSSQQTLGRQNCQLFVSTKSSSYENMTIFELEIGWNKQLEPVVFWDLGETSTFFCRRQGHRPSQGRGEDHRRAGDGSGGTRPSDQFGMARRSDLGWNWSNLKMIINEVLWRFLAVPSFWDEKKVSQPYFWTNLKPPLYVIKIPRRYQWSSVISPTQNYLNLGTLHYFLELLCEERLGENSVLELRACSLKIPATKRACWPIKWQFFEHQLREVVKFDIENILLISQTLAQVDSPRNQNLELSAMRGTDGKPINKTHMGQHDNLHPRLSWHLCWPPFLNFRGNQWQPWPPEHWMARPLSTPKTLPRPLKDRLSSLCPRLWSCTKATSNEDAANVIDKGVGSADQKTGPGWHHAARTGVPETSAEPFLCVET